MVSVDPSASLGIRDVYVEIGGVEYHMDGRSAADWIEQLISSDLSAVVPGWLDDRDEDRILDLMGQGKISFKEIEEAGRDVISNAAGRPWWWALKLMAFAVSDVHHWSRINGRLILAGVDSTAISLSAWVDAVYFQHIEKFEDPDERLKFQAEMDMPPSVEYLNEEEEAEAFLSMLG